jgi:hypothetical protein
MFKWLRILALMLMGALPVIGVALWAVLSATQDVWVLPPPWLMLAQVAAGVSVHFFNEAAGYRTRPIVAGYRARRPRRCRGWPSSRPW